MRGFLRGCIYYVVLIDCKVVPAEADTLTLLPNVRIFLPDGAFSGIIDFGKFHGSVCDLDFTVSNLPLGNVSS